MTKFIMLVGLPASGKSTMANEISVKENAIIHSSDNLREELFGDINDCNKNDELFKELHRRIKVDLLNNNNVIYDATNISHKRRSVFLDELKNINCQKICYLIATPYEKCLEQNLHRGRRVPEHVIKKMYLSFYIPQFYEGWDEINIVWNYNPNNFPFDELKEKTNISQDNPHHTLTIYDHCIKCMLNISEQTDDAYLKIAAMYHDIGKVFTKQFKNFKGENTDIAHYYNHHLVSAYDSLFYLNKCNFTDEEILKITNYIQWHMQPFFIKTEKAKRKFINLVGQEFYDKLLILHESDKNAK